MWQRCTNPKHLAYPFYGGRGVKVDPAWKSYDQFEKDMGESPPGLWLDRIDNSEGYEPGNCRWVTPKESAKNRSRTGPVIDPNSLRQKALKAGIPYHVVYQRIRIHFWPEEKALSEPVRIKSKMGFSICREVGARIPKVLEAPST